jgi:hypothetical protein
MSTMTVVMIFSFIIIFFVIALSVITTNKAYEILPKVNEIDPLPDENTEGTSDSSILKDDVIESNKKEL